MVDRGLETRPGSTQLNGFWKSVGAPLSVLIFSAVIASVTGQSPQPTPAQDAGAPAARAMLGVVWTSSDCVLCHAIDEPTFSHPTDVRPTFAIPADLPLENGRLTCITCHRDDSASHAVSRDVHDGFLRGATPGHVFCAQCHLQADGQSNRAHAISVGRAHLSWGDSVSASSATDPSGLERENHNCLSCHDGSVGQDIGVSHPVAIDYTAKWPTTGRPGRLTPVERLDPRLRLFDNKLACGTCHSVYAREPKLLVMANDRSQICRGCHYTK